MAAPRWDGRWSTAVRRMERARCRRAEETRRLPISWANRRHGTRNVAHTRRRGTLARVETHARRQMGLAYGEPLCLCSALTPCLRKVHTMAYEVPSVVPTATPVYLGKRNFREGRSQISANRPLAKHGLIR
jgi:hypothetical protein